MRRRGEEKKRRKGEEKSCDKEERSRVLGDQLSRSPQYRRYLEMKRQGQTERSCSVPPIPSKGT